MHKIVSAYAFLFFFLSLDISAVQAQSTASFEELWVDVSVNKASSLGTILVLFSENDILVSEETLVQWRVQLPETTATSHYGESYYSLHELGAQFHLERASLNLQVQLPAKLFKKNLLAIKPPKPIELTPTTPGWLLNYDVTALHTGNDINTSGLFELGLFNQYGSFSHTHLYRDNGKGFDSGSVRLNTFWRTDFPELMTSLSIGDFATRSANWSRNMRLAGVKWETNFATQPEMVKVPTLDFAGVATEPSTVDLYINDALRFRQNVPAGPFEIDDFPSVTGYGSVKMIVTDLLGRQQAVHQEFFTDRRVLRAGLHDFSYSVGTVRNNYGRASSDYSSWLADLHHRYGVNNEFTGEVSLRLSNQYRMLGLSGVQTLPWSNAMTFALVGTHHKRGHGQLLQLGIQHQRPHFNFGLDAQKSFENFEISPQFDDQQRFSYPLFQLTSYLSVNNTSLGNLRFAYTRQRREDESVAFMNVGLSKHLGALGFMTLNALRFLSGDNKFQISLSLSVPLGKGSHFNSSVSHYSDRTVGYAQIQRQAPLDTGIGYRLRQEFLDNTKSSADIQLNSAYGKLQASYSHNSGKNAYRATVSGSMSYVGGYLNAGKPISDSFGVVHVPGIQNVRVYAENQHIATTDARGFAFLPRLRAYQRNRVRIEGTDVPLSTEVSSLQREVSPFHRSGIIIDFPIRQASSLLINLMTPDGHPIPVGAKAFLDNKKEPVHIGYDGLLYLTDLQPVHEVKVEFMMHGEQRSCALTIQVPQNESNPIHLGEKICD